LYNTGAGVKLILTDTGPYVIICSEEAVIHPSFLEHSYSSRTVRNLLVLLKETGRFVHCSLPVDFPIATERREFTKVSKGGFAKQVIKNVLKIEDLMQHEI
jgi:hypothetical protein